MDGEGGKVVSCRGNAGGGAARGFGVKVEVLKSPQFSLISKKGSFFDT